MSSPINPPLSPPSETPRRSKRRSFSRAFQFLRSTTSGSPLLENLLSQVAGIDDNARAAQQQKADLEQLSKRSEALIEFLSTKRDDQDEPQLPSRLEANRDLEYALKEVHRIANDVSVQRGKLRHLIDPQAEMVRITELINAVEDAEQRYRISAHTAVSATLQRLEHGQQRVEKCFFTTEQKAESAVLQQRLPPRLAGTRWDPDEGCLDGTRREVIDEAVNWAVARDNATHVLWLNGVAGCGKTALAHSISEKLQPHGVVSSLFFRRDEPRRTDRVFTTLAGDLVDKVPEMRVAIAEAIRKRPDIGHAGLRVQFFELVVEPLEALLKTQEAKTIRPIYVIWDALDESGDPQRRAHLLGLLKDGLSIISPAIRFIITSRCLQDIERAMMNINVKYCTLLTTTKDTHRDLDHYIRHRLQQISLHCSDEDISKLVQRAAGLFIWAATALRLVEYSSFSPQLELQVLLRYTSPSEIHETSMRLYSSLNDLYTVALKAADLSGFADAFQLVVGAIIVLQEPLPAKSLCELIFRNTKLELPSLYPHSPLELTIQVIRNLGAVLSMAKADEPVQILHPSFFDYLTSTGQCPAKFYVNVERCHVDLAWSCLDIMHICLRQDICEIGDPGAAKSDIIDLPMRLHDYVSQPLSYACCHFVSHLQASSSLEDNLPSLRIFYFKDLLFWLEVMSLLDQMPLAHSSLIQLSRLLNNCSCEKRLLNISDDAVRFTEAWGELIRTRPSHIYRSALAFTPQDSELYHTYQAQFPELRVVHGQDRRWSTCRKVLEVSGLEGVTSVAISHDGHRIASGSYDNTIYIWDADTGQVLLKPFKGHTKAVSSVTFSNNGKTLVSGSYDHTICIWETKTGHLLLGPLKGHTKGVTSVALSGDSQRIVSGSYDHTIRVWDAEIGQEVFGPLESHGGFVASVTISRDGQKIVSGSHDGTVHVWNAQTGHPMIALIGHAKGITSVAISADGQRIVSGSYDHSIRVWDANTGQVLLGPLTGHTKSVSSVAFSNDGCLIVSGAHDQTVCLWNAQTGKSLSDPWEEHTKAVTSVIFSCDGQRIISGSYDGTIRVWDTYTGQAPSESIEGHTRAVSSVAFSADGLWIVSGSYDHTLCVWNAQTGQLLLDPLKGHSGFVASVAFSKDGRKLISSSHDRTTRVWDAETGEALSEEVAASLECASSGDDSYHLSEDSWVSSHGNGHICWLPPGKRGHGTGALKSIEGCVALPLDPTGLLILRL